MEFNCNICEKRFATSWDLKRHFSSKIHLNKFNEEQKELIYKLLDLQNNKIKSLRCNSAGGCGKTFTISNNTIDSEMLYIAPSNTACKILRNSGLKNVMTFAKAFGWSMDVDENGSIVNIYDENEFKFKSSKYIVIDEISMLNNFAFSLFKHYIDGKIPYILLGDKYQLLPINNDNTEIPKEVSIIQPSKNNISLFFEHKVDCEIKLFKNMRSTNKITSDLINYTREKTINNEKIFIEPNEKFCDELLNKLHTMDFIFLSYTNAIVDILNIQIRNKLFPSNNEWNVGEKIIVQKTTKAELVFKLKWSHEYIYTGDIYTITNISIVDKYFDDQIYKCYVLELDKKYLLTKMSNQDILRFQKNVKNYLNEIKEEKNIDIKKKLYKDFYFNQLPNLNSNINFCYALTVHKSQGSTFSNVFIVQDDFNADRTLFSKNRLFYTAISRAKNNVFILSNKVNGKGNMRKLEF